MNTTRILFFIIICYLTLFSFNKSSAQNMDDRNKSCIDWCNYCDLYKIVSDHHLPYIELTNGIHKVFNILKYPAGYHFELKCEEINLDNLGSSELVLYWKNSAYGSGGGSINNGVQIYNLDSGEKILDEITYCFYEAFHRPPHVLASSIECRRSFYITDTLIKVGPIRYEASWYDKQPPQDNIEAACTISSLEIGDYYFKNDSLIKK